MNIRGTDPTALAAVTDLFVAPTPPRDGGAGGFQQALQPPRPFEPSTSAAQQNSQPVPQVSPVAKQPDDAPREACRPTEETAEAPVDNTDADAIEPVAEEITEEATAEVSTSDEAADDQDVAAVSLAAAATVVAEQQPLPEQLPVVVAKTATVETPAQEDAEVAAEQTAPAVIEQVRAEPLPEVRLGEQQIIPAVAASTETVVTEAVEVSELPTTTDENHPPAGIGVMPSAITPTANKSTTSNTSSRSNTKVVATGKDKTEPVNTAATSADQQSTQHASVETSTDVIAADQMRNPGDNSDNKDTKRDQAVLAADLPAAPALQQPAELPATAEAKLDMPAAVEAPVVSELHSTHHPAHDPTKLTTTQPLANSALTNRLPAQALVRNTSQQSPPPLHVDAARFLQRVTKAFESARERGGEIRLRLSPPELGALRVEVNMSEQGLAARLEVETNEARTVLLENLPALRERLAEQGLKLEKFDVDLAKREPDQSGGQLPDQPRDRQSQSEARVARTPVSRSNTNTNAPNQQPSITPTTGWQDRQLNVIV